MRYLIVFLLLILTLTACQSNNHDINTIPVRVNRVFSGQTIEVMLNESLITVRLTGIDAPSFKQHPWGKEAKNKLAELLINKKNSSSLNSKSILLETDLNKKDRYDRIHGYIWQNNLLVNEELIAQGYALINSKYNIDQYSERLRNAQEYARIMGKGIWNPTQPMRLSPKEFRQQNQLN